MDKMDFWFEVEVERLDGEQLRVRGRGSRHEESDWSVVSAAPVREFVEVLKRAAEEGTSADACRAQAQALYEAVFQGEVSRVWERLRGAAGAEPVLLKWKARELEEVPLEALCEPGSGGEYLGLSERVLPVRSVSVPTPLVPWEVEGAVRVFGVAPLHEAELGALKVALGESLQKGEVEWLEPAVTGGRARRAYLLDRLATAKGEAEVLCFVGHLGLVEGEPCLRLADEEGGESWLPAADLATALEGHFARNLKLVVLQACEGARPGEVASAAEWLMERGASAVVAHLWKARTDVARQFTGAFLRALTQGGQKKGDVVASLNHARRVVWNRREPNHGAEAFSAVVYLRGHRTTLFDFEGRKVKPPAPRSVSAAAVDPRAWEAMEALLEKPFSLVLGDAWSGERSLHARLEAKLRERLPAALGGTGPHAAGAVPELPAGALAQRYLLHRSRDHLDQMFQEAYGAGVRAMREEAAPREGRPADEALARLEGVARRLSPGVHVTLLRVPLLELALERYRPKLTLYVVQPPRRAGDAPAVARRRAGGEWASLDEVPASLDLSSEMLVLRLFRGYQPGGELMAPLLAEDDYLLGSPELREVLGDAAEACLERLWSQPTLLVGLSLLSWQHRKLLHGLFDGRSLQRGSVALLEPGGHEAELWRRGKGLPGETRLSVVEGGVGDLPRTGEGAR